MRTLLRLFGWLAGLLALTVVLAVVFIPLYLDPNDFKGLIAWELGRRAGRPVEIPGNVRLSVFPWLGFEVGRVTVGNPPGFTDPTFASLDRADLRVKLLPLLRRHIETDTVVVHGLDLRLVRDGAGRTNWADLAAPRPAEAPAGSAATDPGATPLALAVGGLDLRGARVSWVDEATGRRLRVEDVDLRTGSIAPGSPVPLSLALRASDSASALRAEVEVRGQLDTDPTRSQYRLRDLLVEARLSGPPLPIGGIHVTTRGQLEADPAQQSVKAGPVHLLVMGIEADAAAVIEWPRGELRYSASLDTHEANLRPLLEAVGERALTTADPQALTKVTFGTRVAGTARSASASPFSLRVDDSTVDGHVEIAAFAGPVVHFDLLIDRLDLDRYLPPRREAPPAAAAAQATPSTPAPTEAPAAPSAPGPAASTAAGHGSQALPGAAPPAGGEPAAQAGTPPVPLAAAASTAAWLLGADLQGRLRADELRLARLQLTDAVVSVSAKDGLIRLDPVEAQVYEGFYRGRTEIDARQQPPRVRLDERLSGVQIAPLLEALTGKAGISGRADLSLRAELRATDADNALRSLTGEGRFSLRDGAIRGLDLGRAARQARARLEGRPANDAQGPAATDFTEIQGSYRIADAVARNDDLYGKSPLLRLEGRGNADLARAELDYRLTAFVVGTAKGQGGRDLEDLRGVPIPVHVSGPFQDPTYRVDVDEALKGITRSEIRQKVEDTIDRALGEGAAEKAKDLLRGLFR